MSYYCCYDDYYTDKQHQLLLLLQQQKVSVCKLPRVQVFRCADVQVRGEGSDVESWRLEVRTKGLEVGFGWLCGEELRSQLKKCIVAIAQKFWFPKTSSSGRRPSNPMSSLDAAPTASVSPHHAAARGLSRPTQARRYVVKDITKTMIFRPRAVQNKPPDCTLSLRLLKPSRPLPDPFPQAWLWRDFDQLLPTYSVDHNRRAPNRGPQQPLEASVDDFRLRSAPRCFALHHQELQRK